MHLIITFTYLKIWTPFVDWANNNSIMQENRENTLIAVYTNFFHIFIERNETE